MRRRLFAATIAGLTALLAAPVALAATRTVSAGTLSATFTYHGSFPQYTGQHLTITRAGTVVYDAQVRAAGCGSDCGPGFGASPLHIVDLEHTGTPDVVLDLLSGGAHCCSIEQVFSPTATGTFAKAERNFGDPGERIVDLAHNGRFEFLTADDAFAYAFTDYADSGLPVQVLTFSGGRFHDVTRSFPKLIAHDAAVWLRAFRGMAHSHFQNSTGVIAAWAADEDLLGKSAGVSHYLNFQARAGHLNGGAASGSKFVTHLNRFLRRLGYLR